MSRLMMVLVTALALSGCSKKEEVVEAAPIAPPSGAQGSGGKGQMQMAPGKMAQGTELPPGHPPVDGASGGAAAPQGAAEPQGAAGMPAAPAHGAAMSAGVDPGDVKVPKAAGPDARTVAEVFAQKAALSGKSVTIRGKVVKYNPGIMGKNWIHLRDGTGNPGKDNDVTVTSQDASAVGEVVTVQGKVAVDQDIGMGTPYPVIVEGAKVAR